MTTLEKLNKKVEEKRLAFIETKDTKLKEKILKELEEVKNEFELDNLEDIKEDLEIHKWVKKVAELDMKNIMSEGADSEEVYPIYTNLMTSKAMINQYENMITKNKLAIDQMVRALKGSMLKELEKKN